MKVLILAGGLGARFSEETTKKPKPLVEIGGKPIIWHVMKIYAHYGFKDFIVLIGYKGDMLKKYFNSFVEEDWNVQLLETGDGTLKSQRLKQAEPFIDGDNFFLSYGDDVSDVSPKKVLETHLKSNNIVTLSAFPLVSDFGILELDGNNQIKQFREKPRIQNHWINGGFFCMSKEIFKYLEDTEKELEDEVFADLTKINKIGAMPHEGFWKSMNTMKDKAQLEELINKNQAPWIKW